jgi:anaerobic magnesium-protoporphyrin IX monomethyl ester cyclase
MDSYNFHDIQNQGIELHPPLGLGYLAAYFRKFLPNIAVAILDANAMAVRTCLSENYVDMPKLWRDLQTAMEAHKPDLVGISCLFHSTAAPAHKTAAIVKKIDPTIYTVLGGNYAHVSFDQALKDPYVNFVIFSEGELTLLNLVQAINREEDLSTVPGIAFRDQASNIVKTQRQELIANINDIPECDRSSFDIAFYSKYGRQFAFRFLDRNTTCITTLIASRGCPHRCTFCAARLSWGGKIRYRSPSLVVDEMLRLRDQYGVNAFCFLDDNLAAIKRDFIRLADEICRRTPGINWFSLGGMQVSSLSDEVVDAIYRSGCKWFILPVESANPETLKKIYKPHTPQTVARVIQSIRRYDDAWIAANIITGFPFESKADIESNLRCVTDLDLDWVYIFRFMPLPGTQMHQDCVNAGYIQPYAWNPDFPGELAVLNTPEFDADYVAERNYAFNAEYNFFKNRNTKRRPLQAIRDFQYVLTTAEYNALAMYGIGCAYEEMGDYLGALEWFTKAMKVLEAENAISTKRENPDVSVVASISKSFFVVNSQIRYSKLFEANGINMHQRLGEVQRLIRTR